MHWVWVALGGAFGSVLRHYLQQRMAGIAFPWGTLTVNLIGSALIGAMAGAWAATAPPHALRALVMVGILGGFTTFSAFTLENLQLVRNGHALLALANMAISNVLGIGLAAAGYFLARAVARG